MSVFSGPEIPNSGLVMHLDAANIKSYPGSGTSWNDISGSGLTHTLANTSLTVVDNVSCFDVTTTGKSIYETSPNTYTFNTEYTLVSWARMLPDSAVATWRTLWRTTANHPLIVQDATNLIGGYYGSFRSYGLNATTLGLENTWCMYTVVATGGSSTCYINDGSIVGSSIAYSETTRSHVWLGTYQNTGTQSFGHVATGSIYNRPLSVSEITQIFYAFRSRYGI